MKDDKYFEDLLTKNKNELVKKISILRTRCNLSAKELSLRIGMSPSYISRLESQGFMPSIESIIKIVDVCKSSLEEFFYNDMDKYHTDIQIAKLFSQLNEDKKYALLMFLKTA